MDYISRRAALEATCFNCSEKDICDGACDDTDRLRAIPAADVRPVAELEELEHLRQLDMAEIIFLRRQVGRLVEDKWENRK